MPSGSGYRLGLSLFPQDGSIRSQILAMEEMLWHVSQHLAVHVKRSRFVVLSIASFRAFGLIRLVACARFMEDIVETPLFMVS